jgi:hypothetical protein
MENMSDREPEDGQEPLDKMIAAFARAMSEFADGLRAAAEILEKIARDPRIQSGIAGDRAPANAGCHCLCETVHREAAGICDGESVSTVRISNMDVPMCAPCQAARAASKLSRQP